MQLGRNQLKSKYPMKLAPGLPLIDAAEAAGAGAAVAGAAVAGVEISYLAFWSFFFFIL